MKILKKACLSCLKSFSKREVIGKLCIEEVRVDLEHLCSCSRKQCRIFHGSFSVNNYPLVYIENTKKSLPLMPKKFFKKRSDWKVMH